MPSKKNDGLNEKLEELKMKNNSLSNENAKLRAKNAELVDNNMDYYAREEKHKITNLSLREYQRLIFGELHRANEMNSAILGLIQPRNKKEKNTLELTMMEFDQMNVDFQEYDTPDDETDVFLMAEKQVDSIINILKSKVKQLSCENQNSEELQTMELKIQAMVVGLDEIFNPGPKRLNSTVEMKDSSSLEGSNDGSFDKKIKTADENLKNVEKSLRNVEEKMMIAEDNFKRNEDMLNTKISNLREIIKEKDGIIVDLHKTTKTMNEKLNAMEQKSRNSTGNEREVMKLKEELQKTKASEDSLSKQVNKLLVHAKDLKLLLEDANETNNKLSKELEKVKQALAHQEKLTAEWKENEEIKMDKLLSEINTVYKKNSRVIEENKEILKEKHELIINLNKLKLEINRMDQKLVFMKETEKNFEWQTKNNNKLKELVMKYEEKLKNLEEKMIPMKQEFKKYKGNALTVSTNPFAQEMQEPYPKNFWHDESKRTIRDLNDKLMEKDEEIEFLNKVIREIEIRPKTPRRNKSSSS